MQVSGLLTGIMPVFNDLTSLTFTPLPLKLLPVLGTGSGYCLAAAAAAKELGMPEPWAAWEVADPEALRVTLIGSVIHFPGQFSKGVRAAGPGLWVPSPVQWGKPVVVRTAQETHRER